MSDAPLPLPAFTSWPTFPFEGDLRVKSLADPVDEEPPRHGEDPSECSACRAPDSAYIWISERWRVRSLDRPTGLPMVLILESRSHLDMGDLTNLLAAELGVLTVRLERAVRSLDGVARVHVNRWGDGSAHLHVWFLARPSGRLQLRGTFLSLWDDILPRIPEFQWRENLALVAAWLADFGGEALAEPPHIDWQSPAELNIPSGAGMGAAAEAVPADDSAEVPDDGGLGSSVVAAETAELTRELQVPEDPRAAGATTVAIPRETGVSRGTADVGLDAAGSGLEDAHGGDGDGVGGDHGDAHGAGGGRGEGGGEGDSHDPHSGGGGVADEGAGSADRTDRSVSRETKEADPHGTVGAVSPGADRTVNLTAATAGGGEIVRIPTARTAAGETVNLTEVSGGETIRFPTEASGDSEADGSATMRFGTSGITGSGTQTMVFPTGDALAAARAETGDNADEDPRRPAASKS